VTGLLYSMAVLRLAAASGERPLLQTDATRIIRRSALCGSVVTVDLMLDGKGRVDAFGIDARACALGQAAATLLARHVIGRSAGELEDVLVQWRDWLQGKRNALPDWPGIELLAGVKAFPARHAAVLLPFEAAAQAGLGVGQSTLQQVHG
jgi:NifU-like protein involved in Fe-S cluster formation